VHRRNTSNALIAQVRWKQNFWPSTWSCL